MYNYLTKYVKLLNDYVESIPAVNPVFRNEVPIVEFNSQVRKTG